MLPFRSKPTSPNSIANGRRNLATFTSVSLFGSAQGSIRYVNHRTDNGPTRAQSESVNPKPPDRPLQVEKTEADLAASAGDGVKWAGEHDALARGHEKDAFVSRLVAL